MGGLEGGMYLYLELIFCLSVSTFYDWASCFGMGGEGDERDGMV